MNHLYFLSKLIIFPFVHISFRTTKRFCAWLKKHPEIEPPTYLLDHGIESNTGRLSVLENTRKLSKYDSLLNLDINEHFIKNHFKKYKYSFKLSDTDSSTSGNRAISDVSIII